MNEKTPAGELTDEQLASIYFEATGQSLRQVDNRIAIGFARAIIAADRALRASPAMGDVAMPSADLVDPLMASIRQHTDTRRELADAQAALAKQNELIVLLKQEAQIHAQEAKTANSTIYEIYQCVTGATGEPGNWHGAEPVRAALAARDEEIAQLQDLNASADRTMARQEAMITGLTAERDAAMASEAIYRKMCEEAKPFVEANSILREERDALRKDADMFWDHDDAERCHGSIDEILNDTWSNGSLEVGAEFTVQQAIRLPNIKVRVTAIDEENGDVAYEEIDAAMTKEPN